MKTNNPIFILSAERSNYNWFENNDRANDLFYRLEGLGLLVTAGVGSYEGTTEVNAIVVQRPGEDLRELLLNISSEYEQECILMREPSGSTYLINKDWKRDDYIGEFRQVPEPVAKMQKSWTRVNNSYYITRSFEGTKK